LLRELGAEEPEAAYFEDLARSIGRETRRRERRPALTLVPSWGLSSALAAACLLIGLGVGHVALPKTITRTETQTREVQVAGPVREVPVERVVERVVRVPVKVVRTRTVVKRVPVSVPAAPAVSVPAPTPGPALPGVVFAASHETRAPAAGLGIGARPAGRDMSPAEYRTARVTTADLRLIASRLRSDMSTVDAAMGTPALAATLASDMERAEEELDHSLREVPSDGTR
jgi:hypothetical protein